MRLLMAVFASVIVLGPGAAHSQGDAAQCLDARAGETRLHFRNSCNRDIRVYYCRPAGSSEGRCGGGVGAEQPYYTNSLALRGGQERSLPSTDEIHYAVCFGDERFSSDGGGLYDCQSSSAGSSAAGGADTGAGTGSGSGTGAAAASRSGAGSGAGTRSGTGTGSDAESPLSRMERIKKLCDRAWKGSESSHARFFCAGACISRKSAEFLAETGDSVSAGNYNQQADIYCDNLRGFNAAGSCPDHC